jgi:hypothetical protein
MVCPFDKVLSDSHNRRPERVLEEKKEPSDQIIHGDSTCHRQDAPQALSLLKTKPLRRNETGIRHPSAIRERLTKVIHLAINKYTP